LILLKNTGIAGILLSTMKSSIYLKDYIQYLPSQKNINCCSSSATLLAAEMIMSANGCSQTFSRLYLYYTTRNARGKLDLTGTSIKETFDALTAFGVSRHELWPFYNRKVNTEPNIVAKDDAVNYRINKYEEILPTDYKEYLNRGIAPVIGMNVTDYFWNLAGPINNHAYIPVNTTNKGSIKGHAVTVVGYDDSLNSGSWIIANSLGPSWGDLGYAAIPYSCNKDIKESYVIINFAGLSMDKKFH